MKSVSRSQQETLMKPQYKTHQRRYTMITSSSVSNINLALFKFQGKMKSVKRNAKNDHFKSTYVTWDDLVESVIPVLQDCGLLFEQEEGEIEGYKTITTRLTHAESGEFKQYNPYRSRS